MLEFLFLLLRRRTTRQTSGRTLFPTRRSSDLRKRYLADINSKNAAVRSFNERNAINAPLQGSAADIIKVSMINVFERLKKEGLKSKLILQVHDELVFDVLPNEVEVLERIVVEEMENVIKLSVPLIAECGSGKNWLEAH